MKRGFNKLWSQNIWWVVELTLTWSNRKDRRLSKISLIVNPAKVCLTCSYIHTYTCKTNRGRIVVKYWCKPPTPLVSWDRQSALGEEGGWGRICRNGSHAPRSSNQQSLRRDNWPTHSLKWGLQASIVFSCSHHHFLHSQSPRLCFYEHTQSLVTLYNCPWNLLHTGPTTAKLSLQTSFFKFHEKKTWRLGILFRCCGESLNNRTNMIKVEITQKHVSVLDPENTTHKSI